MPHDSFELGTNPNYGLGNAPEQVRVDQSQSFATDMNATPVSGGMAKGMGAGLQAVGDAFGQMSQPGDEAPPVPGPLPNAGVIPNQTPGINPMEQIQPFAVKYGTDLGNAALL
jgi:hypothetical protein